MKNYSKPLSFDMKGDLRGAAPAALGVLAAKAAAAAVGAVAASAAAKAANALGDNRIHSNEMLNNSYALV